RRTREGEKEEERERRKRRGRGPREKGREGRGEGEEEERENKQKRQKCVTITKSGKIQRNLHPLPRKQAKKQTKTSHLSPASSAGTFVRNFRGILRTSRSFW